jgi:hypothetical protein
MTRALRATPLSVVIADTLPRNRRLALIAALLLLPRKQARSEYDGAEPKLGFGRKVGNS